jgi:hypothetical protein
LDLGQDWDALNRTLYPRKKAKGASESNTVFIAHHADRVLRMLGDRDELLFSTGAPVSEALNAIGAGRKPVAIDIAEMDRALALALKSDGGIYEQVMGLRSDLQPTKGRLPDWDEHFIFSAIRSWWGKLLPSSFGIFLSLEGSDTVDSRSILLVFRKGELHEFAEPDLSAVSQERQGDLGEVVKILRERHRVPVQGFAMNRADFEEWSDAGNVSGTWKNIARGLKQNRVTLHPFRFGIAAMIGSRGIFAL